YYVGEPTVVRIGTEPRPKKPAKPATADTTKPKPGAAAGADATGGTEPPTSTSPTAASTG
ncbi:MAG TPA: hypothetical protein VFM67_11540, partial [Gaiella sp.]|nr:hypothetical protein [Gaiella sp.]